MTANPGSVAAARQETAAVYSHRCPEYRTKAKTRPVHDALSQAEQYLIELALANTGTITGAMRATGRSYRTVRAVLHEMDTA